MKSSIPDCAELCVCVIIVVLDITDMSTTTRHQSVSIINFVAYLTVFSTTISAESTQQPGYIGDIVNVMSHLKKVQVV